MSLLVVVVAPKPTWDAGNATTRQIHYMGDLWPPRLPRKWQM